MIGIQFYIGINGQPTLVEDMEVLRSLHNFIGIVLGSEPCTAVAPVVPSDTTRSSDEAFSLPADYNMFPDLDRVPSRTPHGETTKDYARKAWLALRRPSGAREIAKKMIELGWKTKAKNAVTVLSSARSAMNEVGFVSLGNGLWELSDELAFPNEDEPMASPTKAS